MFEWIKRGWAAAKGTAGLYSVLSSELFKVYIMPWLMGAAVVIASFFDVIPIPYSAIITMAILSFAGAAHGLLRWDEWKAWRRVEHKLSFVSPQIAARRRDVNDGPVVGLSIGFVVTSQAAFPIEYEVVQIKTGAGTLHNPKPDKQRRKKFIVSPFGSGFYYDDEISIENPILNRLIDCDIEVKLRYGKPGNLRYDLARTWALHSRFDKDGLPINQPDVNEIA